MEVTPSGLDTPVLLLAMPQILDPSFHRTVVLLLHHTDEGSFGFVVNRQTDMKIAEILSDMDISWSGAEDTCAYFGGPVQPQVGSLLFEDSAMDRSVLSEPAPPQAIPGLLLSHHIDDLSRLAADPPQRLRFYLGYAGWGEGQLLQEILRNDWLTAPVQKELLFSDDPDSMWERAMVSVGVDPATLPSWAPTSDDEEAN